RAARARGPRGRRLRLGIALVQLLEALGGSALADLPRAKVGEAVLGRSGWVLRHAYGAGRGAGRHGAGTSCGGAMRAATATGARPRRRPPRRARPRPAAAGPDPSG